MHDQRGIKSQARQARLRNQLREIEEPFLDEFMRWMPRIDIIALWSNWISLNDESSISEIASILIEAALISEALLMSEPASKDSFNEASSVSLK